ncbi:MaoC family dehydratase [Streptomyces sp. NPDC089424]|uniref:MaoC family dehydratase n=1 Tax=Streptomyces sp. NPDC089424 TaxID=3365917 RepID=UPI0037F95951
MTLSDHLPLVTGALRSPFKHPRPDADFPRNRLLRSGVRVDLDRLAAYARVCGFPTGEDTLPLTYPHVLAFPAAMRLMSGRGFPLPLLGLVHTSVDLTRHTALRADGTYELAVHVEGLAPHRRGTQATVVAEARTEGEVVWESRSTYLARHRTVGAQAREDRTPSASRGDEPSSAGTAWRLAADAGRRYAAVSGDRNPIHLHPLTARPFGFPRPIAHGMWTVARCLAAHGTPEAVRVRAEFRAPVPLPGTVEYAADGGRFALRGDGGRIHLTGTVRPHTTDRPSVLRR